MYPLRNEADDPLEVANIVHSSYDLDAPKTNSCSSSQLLVGSFTIKEEDNVDPLQIKNVEPMKVSNFSRSSYVFDTPKSSPCNSSQALAGSFTLKKEEIADPLQIKNDEPSNVSNFPDLSCGLDTPKSSSCNSSYALGDSFTLNEEGSLRNGCSQKIPSGLVKDLSSTGETIWLTSVSKLSKQREKIYLKTTVEIEKLTKRTIKENSCGKWRCSDCGKIENTFYFLQLHKSTNCETMSKFNCEICRKEIDNYSDFAIHYIEHEADKEKKCPICLCPNINDIKEHLIVKNHLSEDITGFRFTDNECKRSNEKAKQEVFFNSNIDGYCQDFNVDSLSKKNEEKVKKEHLSMVESTPDVQEKPNLRKRKKKTIYVEPFDSDIGDISDEEMDRYIEEPYEGMPSYESDPGKMPPGIYIGHVKVKNHACGNELSQPEEVALKSFGSRWKESSENTHFCKICSESFSLPISLSSHMKCHDDIEIQQCQFYRSEFKKKRNLDYSFGIQNETRDNSYECTICKRTYTIRKSFTNHMRLHSQVLRATALNGKSASDPVSTNHRGLTCDNLNKCATCGSTYKYRAGFLQHMKSNPEHRETHFCNIHNKSFSPDLLFRPQTEVSKSNNRNEMFHCPFCQAKFKKEHHLYCHLVAHRDKTCNLCIRCNMCTSFFALPSELLNHLKMHEKTEASEKTNIASAVQPSENSDAEPTSNSEPITNNIVRENNFNECGICKKTFVKRRSLLHHLRRHRESRKYLCHMCGLGFFKEIVLKMHIQRHTGDKNFTCDKCGNNFYSVSLLNQHLKKHASEEIGQTREKLFECEICHTKFVTKQVYSKHMKKHTEGKRHECGICQRKCYTKYQLAAHMRIHTGEKPYECKICNSTFAQTANLKKHMKSHSEEKPYSCELCSKTFKNKNSVNDHINTHTGTRPYKCKQCDMCFGSRTGIEKHKKIHMRNPEEKKFREKKYSCNICSEAFAVADYRDKHVALHANPNPFSCEFCSKNFNYKKNLVAHVQRVHPSCNPFRCKLCSKTYDTIRKIDVHINSRACLKNDKSHKSKNQGKAIEVDGNTNADNLFICNICNEDFESVEKIQDHFNSSHKPSSRN